ncbi:MAG: lipase, partial [Candidatus Limivicinus sp.]|nr:lipase [Candidatus Limivicinus sp.]
AGQELIGQSVRLAEAYRALALRLGIGFADAGKWRISLCFDGVHFTEDGHRAFAGRLVKTLQTGN